MGLIPDNEQIRIAVSSGGGDISFFWIGRISIIFDAISRGSEAPGTPLTVFPLKLPPHTATVNSLDRQIAQIFPNWLEVRF